MTSSNHAQIYLAGQRSHTETNLIRTYKTLGPDTQREPVGPLWLLSDDTLRAGALTKRVEQYKVVLLLPITDGLEYVTSGPPDLLKPGQTQTLYLCAGDSYTVSNSYPTETINVLPCWFVSESPTSGTQPAPIHFELIRKNRLLPLIDLPNILGLIGRYDGRSKDPFSIKHRSASSLFVVVLTVVFEIANQLLILRDGLLLIIPPGDAIQFGALSNDAVLILFQNRFHNVSTIPRVSAVSLGSAWAAAAMVF